jgi:hypothetical protein
MKLSEAVMLGDVLRTRNHRVWLEPRTEAPPCGCALGGALLATGAKKAGEMADGSDVRDTWPWLSVDAITAISRRFDEVCGGERSLESLVDYIRSIEPEEPVVDPQKADMLEPEYAASR